MYPLTVFEAVLRDHARFTVERDHDRLVDWWRSNERHVGRRSRRR